MEGVITLPGDKSISHRAAILAGLAPGRTTIKNFLFADDCLVTLKVLAAFGCAIDQDKKNNKVTITSKGEFAPAVSVLNMGESGTSARLLLGLLCGQPFPSKIIAVSSLLRRPMARVTTPLRLMGACIKARETDRDEFLPIEV